LAARLEASDYGGAFVIPAKAGIQGMEVELPFHAMCIAQVKGRAPVRDGLPHPAAWLTV